MVKITVIMPVDSYSDNLEQSIHSILNQSLEDFELICVHDNCSEKTLKMLLYHSINDKRVIVKENNENNLIQTINEVISDACGEYILFADSLNILNTNIFENIYCSVINNSADLILFKPTDCNEKVQSVMQYLYRIVGKRIFNHEKISEIIFDINNYPYDALYKKDLLVEDGLLSDEKFSNINELLLYKSILKSDKIMYFNKHLNETNFLKTGINDVNHFKEYLSLQNAILELFDFDSYSDKAANNKISNLIKKYEESEVKSIKGVYSLLRQEFLDILNNSSETFYASLNDDNRKKFEQVIISESVEEFELLKKVSEDKKYINYMSRFETILKDEEKKVENFNKSLVSSKSWKITKIFRLIK